MGYQNIETPMSSLSSTFVPQPAVAGEAAEVLASDGAGGTVWTAASAPGAHASTHADGGADEIDAADLGSGAATDGYVLTADGAGGAAWEAPTGGGGGSVATDAIWDAKGDLAGGTGANAAARLAVGTNGLALVADSAEATGLKWAAPAPASHNHAASEVTSGTVATARLGSGSASATTVLAGDQTWKSGVLSADASILQVVKLTQAAYDALTPKVSTTLYVVEG